MKKALVFIFAGCIFFQLGLLATVGGSQEKENSLVGSFEYNAFYESGAKIGTWTRNHRMSIEEVDGDYYLNWGSLRVKTQRIANGLIYEWKLSDAHGEGIYLFYKNNTKMFGSFRLSDENGEHTGYTEGNKLE